MGQRIRLQRKCRVLGPWLLKKGLTMSIFTDEAEGKVSVGARAPTAGMKTF